MSALVLIRWPTIGWLSIVDAVQILNQNRRMEIDSENLFIPEAFWQKIMNVMDAVLACLLVFYVISNGHLSDALAPLALICIDLYFKLCVAQ